MIMDRRRKISTRLSIKLIVGLVLIGLVGIPVYGTKERQEEAEPSARENLRKNRPWLEVRMLADSPYPGHLRVIDRDGRTYYAAADVILDPTGIADAVPGKVGSENTIQLLLTVSAAERIKHATASHQGKRLGIFLNGELVSAPIVYEPIGGRSLLVCEDTVSAEQVKALIRAWSAPADTSPGKRSLHIQGLGDVEVELQGGTPSNRIQFFLNGSFYNLPLSFVSRPEIPDRERKLVTITVRKDRLEAQRRKFKDWHELGQFVKIAPGPDQIFLIVVSKADAWTQERREEASDVIKYVYENPYCRTSPSHASRMETYMA